jgi:hypothetical protein
MAKLSSALHLWMPQRTMLEPLTTDGSMRMFILLAVAIVLVAIGLASSFSFPHTAALVSVKTPNTLSPHDIHLNYKAMKDLPVHASTNAF